MKKDDRPQSALRGRVQPQRDRAGWFLLDDDVVELDNPMGSEQLIEGHACFENETMILTPEPAPLLDEPGVVA
jgi:hypothetical protein